MATSKLPQLCYQCRKIRLHVLWFYDTTDAEIVSLILLFSGLRHLSQDLFVCNPSTPFFPPCSTMRPSRHLRTLVQLLLPLPILHGAVAQDFTSDTISSIRGNMNASSTTRQALSQLVRASLQYYSDLSWCSWEMGTATVRAIRPLLIPPLPPITCVSSLSSSHPSFHICSRMY